MDPEVGNPPAQSKVLLDTSRDQSRIYRYLRNQRVQEVIQDREKGAYNEKWRETLVASLEDMLP